MHYIYFNMSDILHRLLLINYIFTNVAIMRKNNSEDISNWSFNNVTYSQLLGHLFVSKIRLSHPVTPSKLTLIDWLTILPLQKLINMWHVQLYMFYFFKTKCDVKFSCKSVMFCDLAKKLTLFSKISEKFIMAFAVKTWTTVLSFVKQFTLPVFL